MNHGEVVAAAQRIEDHSDGALVFAGNYLRGVGLPDAVLSGMEAAENVCRARVIFNNKSTP